MMKEMLKHFFARSLEKKLGNGDIELAFAFSEIELFNYWVSDEPPEVVYVFSDINIAWNDRLGIAEKK